MKLKKLISYILAIGLLSNSGLTSLAEVISEDGRYETFEGSKIIINNVLESEDNVDMEIEGNTMVNVANQREATAITSSSSSEGASRFDLYYLYPNTEYIIQFESDNTGEINKALLSDAEYQNYSVKKGVNKFNITTPSQISSNELILDGSGFNLFNLVVTENISEDFSYFEGMKSVGQDDENGHRIEIKSNNSNDTLSNKMEILLSKPLRGFPGVVKDRIIKRNDEWVVERNFSEVVLDGSSDESWTINNPGHFVINKKCNPIQKSGGAILCDKLASGYGITSGSIPNSIWCGNNQGIQMNKFTNVNTGKQWLSENPITVIYQLATPIYESLDIDSTISTYLDKTYISSSSNIPANIKVTVDRTANIAKEAIELARFEPTAENISQAQYWTSLLKESTLKDSFQNEIDNIIILEDLKPEKKTLTSNIDVYIKFKNSLSMSLSTNYITFDNYSSVNDLDMDNALKITVNSSLPYRLNSYLESEIQNISGDKKIDKYYLQIKEDSDNEYKQFSGINQKLILKEDCESGKTNTHDIDIKLKAGTHDADVYKTVLKFEAEQK